MNSKNTFFSSKFTNYRSLFHYSSINTCQRAVHVCSSKCLGFLSSQGKQRISWIILIRMQQELWTNDQTRKYPRLTKLFWIRQRIPRLRECIFNYEMPNLSYSLLTYLRTSYCKIALLGLHSSWINRCAFPDWIVSYHLRLTYPLFKMNRTVSSQLHQTMLQNQKFLLMT